MSRKILNVLTAPVGLIFGKKVGTLISAAAITIAGIATGNLALISAGLSVGASALKKRPEVNAASVDRLTARLDPHTPRKLVFGHTAMAADVRYQGYTDDQTYLHWIVVCAAHEVESLDEIWFDTKKAWTASGGVQSAFSGYLQVDVRNPGTSSNGIAIDSAWTADCTLTGCAYVRLRFKLTGNSKKAESPFSQSIPTRLTIRGKGALLPDVRETGCAADTQTTWDWFDEDSGRNPALQLLFFLIGWTINGKLSVAAGMPLARLNIDSFITGANLCDEPVTKAAGGTEPRYRCDGVFSEGENPKAVIDAICATMNAVLRDDGGWLTLDVIHDDLDDPDAIALGPDDIIGNESWRPVPSEPPPNIVRGRWTDPSDTSLYQLSPETDVSLTSVDGIDRYEPFDLPQVQSSSQWQRLAKQRLQRLQYQGVYSADLGPRAWGTGIRRIVKLSHPSLGWADKLFRVAGQEIRPDGIVPLVAVEENAAIYAWDAEETAPVQAAAPTVYDPALDPIRQAIDEVELTPGPGGLAYILTNPSAQLPADKDGNVLSYALAAGAFVARAGSDDVSSSFALSTAPGGNPQGLTAAYAGQDYSVTAGFDTGEDTAELTIRATGSGDYAGVTIDLPFRLTKSKTGATGGDGSDAKLLTVSASRQFITLDAAGDPDPAAQDTAFAAVEQGASVEPWWVLKDAAGAPITATASYLTGAGSGSQLCPYSQQFDQWTASNASVSADAEIAPDGTLTADTLTDASAAAVGTISQSFAIGANSNSYVFSIFVKKTSGATTRPGFAMRLSGGTQVGDGGLTLNTDTGVATAIGAGVTVNAVEDYGGYWRLSFYLTNNSTNTTLTITISPARGALTGGSSAASTGSVTVWGANVYVGTSALVSYIESGSAAMAAVRGFNAAMTAANFQTGRGSTKGVKALATVCVPPTGSTPGVVLRDGVDVTIAQEGQPGLNNAVVTLYKRAASSPSAPSGTFTYTFATGALSGGTLNGWTQAVPAADGNPLWRIAALASAADATDTIAASEFTSPVLDTGAGVNQAIVRLWKRSATAPTAPTGTFTYTFATGALSGGTLNGYSQTPPAADGNPLWHIQAIALSTGATDSIPASEFSTTEIFVEDGEDGANGNKPDVKFIRSLAQPATPTGDDPAGWSDGVPPGTDTLWMIRANKTYGGTLIGVWSTPESLSGTTPRGPYGSSETYYLNNFVTYEGGTYIAVQDDFSGEAPSGTAEATAYWDVVAAPGAPGEPGTPPSAFSATIDLTSSTGTVNLRTIADANGYTGLSDATITFRVPNGVTIRGLTNGSGISTGTWPTGSYTIALTLVIQSGGVVEGGGGRGGKGGSGGNGSSGSAGGDGVNVLVPMTGGITINSGGALRGGGGGGAGGDGGSTGGVEPQTSGGGGGGGGAPNGSGGAGGAGDISARDGDPGAAGTTSGGGAGGGLGGTGASAGGNGGGYATAGSSSSGQSGGAAGKAVEKNGNAVTVTNNGTMVGAAS